MIKQSVLGIIPARGGSKGIPQKNISDLSRIPLIGHVCTAAREATKLDTVILSSDDAEIIAAATIARVNFPSFEMVPKLRSFIEKVFRSESHEHPRTH